MEEFYLFNEQRVNIPLQAGFPEGYLKKYGFPGSDKYHAFHGKMPLLFQTIKVGEYEIVNSDYLTTETDKIGARSPEPSLELHFLLTGKLHINLKGLGWVLLDAGSHNLTTLPAVKSEVYFKITPVSTFDIHFTEALFTVLARKYPKLAPILEAYKNKKVKSLFRLRTRTTPLILHLIVQLKAALKAGLENEPSTLELVEKLICLVLEDEPVVTNFHYDYNDIEKIHEAHRLIAMYLDEQDILINKMQETNIKFPKFREGFKLLYECLPHQYLQEKRLEKALKLATEDRTSTATDIAHLCGYSSGDYLSRQFLKHYGYPISHILQANRKNSN